MKKKDILFLLQFFYPEYISSATLPFDTAKEFAKSGLSVDVWCGYPHEYTDGGTVSLKETVHGINIRRIKYIQLDRKKKMSRLVNYLSLTVMMLLRLFSMRKYRTIFVYSNPPILPFVAALASKLFNCKLVFVAYDLYPEIAVKTQSLAEGSVIVKLMNRINRIVYKNASGVVALSTEMKDFILKNREISKERVFVIPNWYKDEYNEETSVEGNTYNELVNGRIAIGYFGNMGIAQDMEAIKKAILYYKNDPKICFLLAGHGAKQNQIRELVEKEQIPNVYTFDFLKGKDYLDALKISSCAIVSLQAGLTGLCVPSKTYAYMMQGLPIVAIMDESDIVADANDGAGYHVKNNSAEELISIIATIKASPMDCKIKGNNSRGKYLKKYTPEICLNKYVQMITQI